MAPSFDCAVVPSLLCAEDESVFDDSDNYEASSFHRNHRNEAHGQSFSGGYDPPLQSEEGLSSLISKESDHLPTADYLKRLRNGDLDLVARTEAIDWIIKVGSHFGFGPVCEYLSINYLDRFISSYDLPKGKAWMMQLLAVACLSLAAKMEETEVPLSLDLQLGESKFVFEARTIQRMELLVLSTLKWRMQAVTPLAFLDYFNSMILSDQTLQRITVLKSIQLLSCIVKGIDLLEFKPSEIAAAVVISSAIETPTALVFERAVSAFSPYVPKERLLKCIELVRGRGLIGGFQIGNGTVGSSSIGSAPQSPNGVLEAAAACLSFKSDDATVVDVESQNTS